MYIDKITEGCFMRIFRENSYDIVRLYINQIGITIFSMFLYTAAAMVDDDELFLTLRICVSIFSVLFYLSLLHNVVWEIGATDKIRIDSGKLDPQPMKGAVMALFANVPNFLLAFLAIVFVSIFMLSGAEWSYSVFVVIFTILRFHTSMYMGIIQGVTPATPDVGATAVDLGDCLLESALFLVMPLIAVAVTQLSYHLGMKEKKLFGFLGSGASKSSK